MAETKHVMLFYKKSTPGTHVFENRDDPFLKTVYINKAAFNGGPPRAIALTFTESSGQTEKDIT